MRIFVIRDTTAKHRIKSQLETILLIGCRQCICGRNGGARAKYSAEIALSFVEKCKSNSNIYNRDFSSIAFFLWPTMGLISTFTP